MWRTIRELCCLHALQIAGRAEAAALQPVPQGRRQRKASHFHSVHRSIRHCYIEKLCEWQRLAGIQNARKIARVPSFKPIARSPLHLFLGSLMLTQCARLLRMVRLRGAASCRFLKVI